MLLGITDEPDKKDELTSFIDSRRCSCIVVAAADAATEPDADAALADAAAAVDVAAADFADTREVTSSLDSCCCSSCCCCRG